MRDVLNVFIDASKHKFKATAGVTNTFPRYNPVNLLTDRTIDSMVNLFQYSSPDAGMPFRPVEIIFIFDMTAPYDDSR